MIKYTLRTSVDDKHIKDPVDIRVKTSNVTIVANIWLAIVGNETMLLIDSEFNNRKLWTSARNSSVRINDKQIRPKWWANAWIVIRNHNEVVFNYQRCNYLLKKMAWIENGLFSSNLIWQLLLYTTSEMVSKCMNYDSAHNSTIFEINFDHFWLINRVCAPIITSNGDTSERVNESQEGYAKHSINLYVWCQ
jgi:hypothetical protein